MLSSLAPTRSEADRSLSYITVVVVLVHVLLLVFAAIQTKTAPPPQKQVHLVVKTIQLNSDKVQSKSNSKKQAAARIEPQAEVEVQPAEVAVEHVMEKEQIEQVEEEKVITEEKQTPSVSTSEPAPPAPAKITTTAPSKIVAPKKQTPKPDKPKATPKEKSPPTTKPIKAKKEPEKKESSAKKEKKIKKEQPIKKESPKAEPKKSVKAATTPSKSSQKTAPTPSKPSAQEIAASAKRKELLSHAQKSIAKIGQARGTLAASDASLVAMSDEAGVPSRIESLHIESISNVAEDDWSPQERSYYDELASRLKLLLRLPEYGEIKIKLTLERSGQFLKVNILGAKSAKNREYVEKTLPTLKYPGFGHHFGDASQYTFVISLSNIL